MLRRFNTLDCHKVVFVALTALTVAFSITQEEDLHGESRISLVIANFAWWHLLNNNNNNNNNNNDIYFSL